MSQLHQIIPITQGNIGNHITPMVSAKRLHAFLGVGRDFTNWIKGRISQYGFTTGVDYIIVESLSTPKRASAKSRQQMEHDYLITIDMGKELAMVERNEKGRQVRRYFITCEQQAKMQVGTPSLPNFSDPAQAARAWADEFEARQRAETVTHQQAEYIEHLESLFTDGLSPVQFCKRLNGVNTSKISAWLVSANWLYDDNPEGRSAQWRVRSYARDKYLTEKSSKVSPNSAVSFTTYQPVLLREGAVWLYKNYLKGKLPMKVTWNGSFTHDKDLAGGLQ
ncbi:antA/AntB antirepressor family protein [Citrobacter freundii]|uniref:antA/AntB antirepressor family protein n=1 Tax=Citrobacter freundii TaxID=546 RepID=UPI0039788728